MDLPLPRKVLFINLTTGVLFESSQAKVFIHGRRYFCIKGLTKVYLYGRLKFMGQTETEIARIGYRCLRCGHTWVPRGERRPRMCPKCKSVNWDVPLYKEELEKRIK